MFSLALLSWRWGLSRIPSWFLAYFYLTLQACNMAARDLTFCGPTSFPVLAKSRQSHVSLPFSSQISLSKNISIPKALSLLCVVFVIILWHFKFPLPCLILGCSCSSLTSLSEEGPLWFCSYIQWLFPDLSI